MVRSIIFNLLCKLEDDYNKSWRAYRKDYGRKDAVARWVTIK